MALLKSVIIFAYTLCNFIIKEYECIANDISNLIKQRLLPEDAPMVASSKQRAIQWRNVFASSLSGLEGPIDDR